MQRRVEAKRDDEDDDDDHSEIDEEDEDEDESGNEKRDKIAESFARMRDLISSDEDEESSSKKGTEATKKTINISDEE